ncbi:hypothetical protein OHV05_24545 [Kitasatospora sp. NBC_00070]|uniref:hypothetical protein n=1 Tax=Kitasatospora sp. NBC_00070 TaxID=2975962 RepID=UPI00325478F8
MLLHRVTAWWAADGVKSGIARIIGTLLAAAFGAGMLLAAPGLWWPLAAVWLIASWFATPAAVAEDEAEEEENDPGAFLASLHHLIGDQKGVHLAQIAAELLGDETATDRVREQCSAASVTISRGVRVKGRGVSTGVRRDSLPPLPAISPTAPVAVVTAGQNEQQQQQHPGQEGFVVLPDPDGNPHRHQIHWVNQPTRKAS